MAMKHFFGISAVACIVSTAGSSIAMASPNVGDPAPALSAPELDGHAFDLSAERGKVVIVNFWATWCGPCRQEMPRLDAFFRQHSGDGVVLVGISVDRSRDRDQVQKVMAAFSYPAAMLSDASANGFGRPNELPATYVIGPDGIVRDKLIPTDDTGISTRQLEDAVLPLLPPGRTTPAAQVR